MAPELVRLRDRAVIEAFLRRDPFLHVYELGDLDEPFWPHTCWQALNEGQDICALALLFTGLSCPTLLALAREESPVLMELLRRLRPELPDRFYAHLRPGLAPALASRFRLEPHGLHHKMALLRPDRLDAVDPAGVSRLSAADEAELLSFYAESYPGNWFEPRMLTTGLYFGLRQGGVLSCVAGVHVHSARYRVAALGNIATRPSWRGRGLARAVTASLCRELMRTASHIGLNVKADNEAAVRCYRSLGFEAVASYEEFSAGA